MLNADACEAAPEWTLAQHDTGGCAAQILDVDGDGCITLVISTTAGAYTASIQSLDDPDLGDDPARRLRAECHVDGQYRRR